MVQRIKCFIEKNEWDRHIYQGVKIYLGRLLKDLVFRVLNSKNLIKDHSY